MLENSWWSLPKIVAAFVFVVFYVGATAPGSSAATLGAVPVALVIFYLAARLVGWCWGLVKDWWMAVAEAEAQARADEG
jgi:hypothetical protein